jgi:hypothetical protein
MGFPRRANKFNAKRTEYVSPLVGARTYDSMAEAGRAMQLDLLWKAGEVLFWLPQPRFPISGGNYYGDFQVHWADGRVTFEDVKGRDTDVSKLKRAFVKDRYGVEIELVRMR